MRSKPFECVVVVLVVVVFGGGVVVVAAAGVVDVVVVVFAAAVVVVVVVVVFCLTVGRSLLICFLLLCVPSLVIKRDQITMHTTAV